MKFAEVTTWVEAHPTESIVIGAGGVLVVLWLLGAFSSSGSSSNAGASNLASAYYAAEAQQSVVAGQIQMATVQSAAATAQNAAQVNGAVAINKAQTKAATTINGQNASAATTINASADALGATQSNNQLLATYSNNQTAAQITQSNNATQAIINDTNNKTSILQTIWGKLIPQEIALTGGSGIVSNIWGQGSPNITTSGETPKLLAGQGYTPAQSNFVLGLP